MGNIRTVRPLPRLFASCLPVSAFALAHMSEFVCACLYFLPVSVCAYAFHFVCQFFRPSFSCLCPSVCLFGCVHPSVPFYLTDRLSICMALHPVLLLVRPTVCLLLCVVKLVTQLLYTLRQNKDDQRRHPPFSILGTGTHRARAQEAMLFDTALPFRKNENPRWDNKKPRKPNVKFLSNCR